MPLFGKLPKGEWYSEYAICPMCSAFNTPTYHAPDNRYCTAPEAVKAVRHNHLRCSRCHFEWTLPPREPEIAERTEVIR